MFTEEKRFEIHHYEIDIKKRALISRIMNFFDDIAISQSEKLGIGMEYLGSRDLTWVLCQWKIAVHEYPVYREKIIIKTAPVGFNKFYAYRNYSIRSGSGKTSAEAESVWFLVDLKSKRPVKIPVEIYNAYGVPATGGIFFENIKIEPPSRKDVSLEFAVSYLDIDTNEHVNNARYVDWSLEALPYEILVNYTLHSLKIIYKREARRGDMVTAVSQIEESGGLIKTLHEVTKSNGNIICLLENEWHRDSKP